MSASVAATGSPAPQGARAQTARTAPGTFRLAARPEPILLHRAHTAVLVVDMQNDFGAKGGMFDRAGIDISGIRSVVPTISKVLDAARRSSLPVVYLKMGYHPDLSDLGDEEAPNRLRHLRLGVGDRVVAPDGSQSRILVRDTWNTSIVLELTPKPGDQVLYKHRFSGFFETRLDETLKGLEVRQLVVTGCTTSICVESTVRDAMFRDYACVVLADCTAEPIGYGLPRSNHEASLLAIETLFGWVSTSGDLLSALARG